jgi:prophage regulatory protein
MSYKIQRVSDVQAACGKSRSSIYLEIQAGLFSSPIALSARSVGWPEHEVQALVAARIAGKSDDEIRKLVAQLEAARKSSR